MSRRRSIGERLARAGSSAVRREIVGDWADAWLADHARTLGPARSALRHGDLDEAERLLGQLDALMSKAATGMTAVVAAMEDDDGR